MDDLDRILADDPFEPSSGFSRAVMDAVRRQATEPPSIPFPWLRFIVGVGACVILAAAGAALLPPAETIVRTLASPLAPLAAASRELGYAALALIVSLVLARLPRAFVRP